MIKKLEKEIEEDNKEKMSEEEIKKILHKRVEIKLPPNNYEDINAYIKILVSHILRWYIGGEFFKSLRKEKEGIKYTKFCDTELLENIYIEYSFE